MTVRIYTASKLYMAEAWKELRVQVIDVEFTARWPDTAYLEMADERKKESGLYERAWVDDEHDVKRADVVLAYGGSEDVLCGALVEVGIGIGAGKTIICVGSSKSFGTWQHHPNVFLAKTVIEAIDMAKKLFK